MGRLCLTTCFRILGSRVAAETSFTIFAPAWMAPAAVQEHVVSMEIIGFWFRCGNVFWFM